MLWLQYNAQMPRKYIFTKIYPWFRFWSLKTNLWLDQLIFGHSTYPYYALNNSNYALQQSNSFIAIFNHSNLTSLKNSILGFKLCSEIRQALLRIIKSLSFLISKERTSFVLQNQTILFALWNLSRIFGNSKISFVHRNKEIWSFTKYFCFCLKLIRLVCEYERIFYLVF
jgi:hypothetical protein